MEIDKQSLRHFNSIKARQAALPNEPTLKQLRAFERETKQLMTACTIPVEFVQEKTVPTRSSTLSIRTYRNSMRRQKACFLWFHGGGHVLGTLDSNDDLCRLFVSMLDILVINATYRLAPEYPFPAAHEDALAIYNYVSGNNDFLGYDAEHLIVGGASAGGNLAAAVCQSAIGGQNVPIFRQILIYPVLDMEFTSDAHTEFGEGYQLTTAAMKWFRARYVPNPDQYNDPRVSPLHAQSVSGLPPTHIITAEFDPLRSDGETYAQRLEDADVPVIHKRYEGVMHGFFSDFPVVAKGRQAVAEVCNEITKAIMR